MNTQDLARAVELAKDIAERHAEDRELDALDGKCSCDICAVGSALLALHSRHAAMVGELESMSEEAESRSSGPYACDSCRSHYANTVERIDTILSQHAAEGKEEGRG